MSPAVRSAVSPPFLCPAEPLQGPLLGREPCDQSAVSPPFPCRNAYIPTNCLDKYCVPRRYRPELASRGPAAYRSVRQDLCPLPFEVLCHRRSCVQQNRCRALFWAGNLAIKVLCPRRSHSAVPVSPAILCPLPFRRSCVPCHSVSPAIPPAVPRVSPAVRLLFCAACVPCCSAAWAPVPRRIRDLERANSAAVDERRSVRIQERPAIACGDCQ
jgi:hypothetical protein